MVTVSSCLYHHSGCQLCSDSLEPLTQVRRGGAQHLGRHFQPMAVKRYDAVSEPAAPIYLRFPLKIDRQSRVIHTRGYRVFSRIMPRFDSHGLKLAVDPFRSKDIKTPALEVFYLWQCQHARMRVTLGFIP